MNTISLSDTNYNSNNTFERFETTIYNSDIENFFDTKNVPKFDYTLFYQEIIKKMQCNISGISLDNSNKDNFIGLMKIILSFLSTSLPPIEETFRSYQNTIDELHEKSSILQYEKEKLSFIVNKLNSGILVLDEDGYIQLANSTIKYYFQKFYHEELVEGLNINFLASNPFLNLIISDYKRPEHISKKFKLTEDFFILIEFSRLIKSNQTFTYVIECKDISSFIQYDRMRNSFISMVSHELRNPITSINYSISNLITYYDKLDEEKRNKLYSIISSNSKLMSEVINDLLLITRLDEHKIKLEIASLSLNECLENIKLQLAPKIYSKNIQLVKEIQSAIVLRADRKRLEQILRILLDNAIKYSHTYGKITILATDCEIKGKSFIQIKIKDNGLGIKENDLHNLFQRFYRSSEVSQIQGSGLGLSIAKQLVELHGGNISVESYYGQGSTFEIDIPFNPAFQT